jgi:tRNA-specific 2-thiouridylase
MAKKKEAKIAVAMSGGVDSSVSTLLLKEKGYEMAGFYMNLGCDLGKNARAVAKKINVSFFEVDARKEFKKAVIDYFISEYKNLRTPNPCVVCNKKIKFGWLLETAKKKKFNMFATGHYVRVKKDLGGVYHLFKGKDEKKDQSYFLYKLNQSQLKHVIFPLGEMSKDETKKIAAEKELSLGDQKESQDVCFLEDGDYRKFLSQKLPKKYFKSGNIVDTSGETIGRHQGLINYTIGQRKGIDQSINKNENRQSLYVIGFNSQKNELIVGQEKDIFKKEMIVGDLSWISNWAKEKTLNGRGLKVKIRYRHEAVSSKIKREGKNKIKVVFKTPQRAVTPGQSAVFYFGEEVLGGGIIE